MLGSNEVRDTLLAADSVKMTAVVSAEWNQNLFNSPYITIAGDGVPKLVGDPSPEVEPSPVTKDGFVTNKAVAGFGRAKITFPISSNIDANAYKIVTFVRTNNISPVVVNTFAKTGNTINDAYGSKSVEVNSYSWTKIETYIGSSDQFNSFDYTIAAYNRDSSLESFDLYFTEPEAYEITKFDYLNGTLWPTDEPFTYFRPGESYVGSGNANLAFANQYRNVLSRQNAKMPITPVAYCPRVATLKAPLNPFLKHGMLSDISPYRYFVSDENNKSISAYWKPSISANKIVLKFQTLLSSPTVQISINNGEPVEVVVESPGLAVLYWSGTAWTKNCWQTMPTFGENGDVTNYATISKITVTQTDATLNSEYSSLTASTDLVTDFTRMHLIEVSPRLEVDVSDFVQTVNINKSLDNNQIAVPISSIEANDASITLSSIPFFNVETGTPLPVFSNENNTTQNVLSNLLRKNVKFNISLLIEAAATQEGYRDINEYVQAGVFFADSWQEQDVDSVTVSLFDVSRYLQNTPVPDYISKFRPVFEILTDIFDFVGFTDYDYDSLYDVCVNPTSPLDVAYYFANSKDKTVFEAIREIFLAYQIGAFIDEWGIMRFVTLTDILQNPPAIITINDEDIVEGTFNAQSTARPGKISIRYQSPKILQSASLQNIQDSSIINSPSFVLTTSNDVVWQQQSADSSGFNVLKESMLQEDSHFKLDIADLLDIFHTYSADFNGYAVIEDEIVSFEFKEYEISGTDYLGAKKKIVVAVTGNIELQARINDFIKNNRIFREDVTVAPTGNIVNVKRGMFGTQVRDHKIIEETIVSKGLSEGQIGTNGIITKSLAGTYAKVSAATTAYNKNKIEISQNWQAIVTNFTGVGYFVSGYTTAGVDNSVIDKYYFPADQRTTLNRGLSVPRFELAGFGYGSVAAYMAGGFSPSLRSDVSSVDKILFKTDARSTLALGLSSPRGDLAGLSNTTTAAYAVGGTSGANAVSTVDRFAFPTESRSTTTSLSIANYEHVGISNSGTTGYVGGGTGDGATSITDVYTLTFATNAWSKLPAGLTVGTSSMAGMANLGTAGYFCGGYTTAPISSVTKFNFANNARTTLTLGLSANKYGSCGMQDSSVAGYVGGGTIASVGNTDITEKFTFPTDIRSTVANGLSIARRDMGAASSVGKP